MVSVFVMVALAGCSRSEIPLEATSTPEAASNVGVVEGTPEPTASPQPSIEELYRPQAYLNSTFSYTTGPTRVPPPSLEAANAEAATWLRTQAFEGEAPAWFLDLAGSAERRCAEVAGDASRVRSGDFVVDVTKWSGANPIFELLPARSSREPLLLRAVHLDDRDAPNPATHVHEYDGQLDWNEADEFSYTPRFVPPRAGRWMVVATAGTVWGCFVVEAAAPPPGLEVARSIEDAEAAGAAYPSVPPPERPSPAFTNERGPGVREGTSRYIVDGTAERVCLDVAGIHDARSGEWVLRPASIYAEGWSATLPGTKVLLVPLHQPESTSERVRGGFGRVDSLRLTSTFLDDPRHTHAYEQAALTAATASQPDGVIDEFSHVATFVHPRRGTWLMVATSGERAPDWGCFVVEAG